MAPARRLLQVITGNVRHRRDLKPAARGVIIAKRDEGKSYGEICEDLQIPRSTVRDTIKKSAIRPDQQSLPGRGRKRSWTERDARHIYQYLRANPLTTYARIREDLGVPCVRTRPHDGRANQANTASTRLSRLMNQL